MTNPPSITWTGITASFEVQDSANAGAREVFLVKFEPKLFRRPSRSGYIEGFEILFMRQIEERPGEYDIKSDPGIEAMDVFGGVIQAIREFQYDHAPGMLWYTAAEPTRIGAYVSMLPRQVTEGYVCEHSTEGNPNGRGEFVIIRKELV